MGKGKFAGFTQQSAEPEYPAPAPVAANVPLEPAPAPKRAKPALAAAATTARKLPFSSYVALADHERFERLVESSGKSRVRLLSEALALLFKHYRC
jgi:hypothetical protein